MKNPLISIIIRIKNEERWISSCLSSVFDQCYKNFEVIIVNNNSTDKTLEKIKPYPIKKIFYCEQYRPGRALNMGIRQAEGEYIVCLSGHCIPTHNQWLENLLKNFEDTQVAGVYGRQEPLAFTPDADKRDLTLVFGLDKKIQKKDSFFHNANSMIRKDMWERFPFNENTTNIEDRLWAEKILKERYIIVYEPQASVYHHHGIHQNGDQERCSNVVRILEDIEAITSKTIDMDKLDIAALIPVRGPLLYTNNEPLLFYTIQRALESTFIKKVIVSTDDEEIAQLAKKMGAQVPFIRNPLFSKDTVDLLKVFQFSLEKLEALNILPDLLVTLESTFPFRTKDFIDHLILNLVKNGLDSVVSVKKENRAIWKQKNNQITQMEEGFTPRKFKDPLYIELRGLGCVTYPQFLREGRFMGDKVGIFEVSHPYSHIEIRDEKDLDLANMIISSWNLNSKN